MQIKPSYQCHDGEPEQQTVIFLYNSMLCCLGVTFVIVYHFQMCFMVNKMRFLRMFNFSVVIFLSIIYKMKKFVCTCSKSRFLKVRP